MMYIALHHGLCKKQIIFRVATFHENLITVFNSFNSFSKLVEFN